jgi:hypothetical protein
VKSVRFLDSEGGNMIISGDEREIPKMQKVNLITKYKTNVKFPLGFGNKPTR